MIQVEPRGEVAIIRLDRPAKKNAQTPEMLASLAKAVETAISARAIVLSGVGDTFCAGFDLSMAQADEAVLERLLRNLSRAARALREAPCPVVASAHGAAIAGGCALLCGCDFVVTHEGAKIGYPAVRLGISPAVSAPHLCAQTGFGPARTLQLDPGLISGREARRIGLASDLAATGPECEPRAIVLARSFAVKPRHALGYTRRWLNEIDGSLDESSHEAAMRSSLACVGTAELRERLAAAWRKV
ncbi:Crotonyl-CoA hydratase [Phycisphaerales bacterium]|nr:Crotonyl-CoA hydratase [Phycisphaerales bacterium]